MSDWYNIIRYNYKPVIFEAVEKLDTLEEKIKVIENLIQKLRDKKEEKKDNETESYIAYLENEDRQIEMKVNEENWAEYSKYNSNEEIERLREIMEERKIAWSNHEGYELKEGDIYILRRAINAGVISPVVITKYGQRNNYIWNLLGVIEDVIDRMLMKDTNKPDIEDVDIDLEETQEELNALFS